MKPEDDKQPPPTLAELLPLLDELKTVYYDDLGRALVIGLVVGTLLGTAIVGLVWWFA